MPENKAEIKDTYQRFFDYMNAGYPLIWIQTQEDARVISEISRHDKDETQWYVWDIAAGFRQLIENAQAEEMEDPTGPIKKIESLPDRSVVFLKDFHLFITNPTVFRMMKNLIPVLETTEKHLVVISPTDKMPIEIETDFVIWDFPLPDRDELVNEAKKLAEDNDLTNINEEYAASAAGMGLNPARNAFSLSLVTRGGKLDRELIEEQKKDNIRRVEGLEWFPVVEEKEVGGLDNMKDYFKSRCRGFTDPKLPLPKGVLLVGLPGAGKSLSAKMAAHIFQTPLIRFDLGSLKGSLVGETESKTRKALQVIDANAPLVVWVDEKSILSTLNPVNCWDTETGSAVSYQQPSLGRNSLEGSEVRAYRPERTMKLVGSKRTRSAGQIVDFFD